MSKIIYTPDAPEALGPYSQAVITGGLFLRQDRLPLIRRQTLLKRRISKARLFRL